MTPDFGSRSLFPSLEWEVYLNHASVSPLPLPVQVAATQAMADVARRGLGAVGDAMALREELRTEMAALLGVDGEGIGFPPGTTRGIVDIALAIPWRAGDRIVVFEGEFPSNVNPWLAAARRFDLEVIRLPLTGFGDGSGLGLARVEEALAAGGVRLVAVSAVQFSTGLRMPLPALGQLAHARGAQLFVDGIQAVGGLPLDLRHVDYLVAGAHKWLMAVDGLAVAYATAEARHGLSPLTAGWLSVEKPLDFLFEGSGHLRYDRPVRATMDWMEGGVQTWATFAGLLAAVRLLAVLRPPAIAAHVQRIHDAMEPRLLELGFSSARASQPDARSNILSMAPPTGTTLGALAEVLEAHSISASTPDGWLRFSPHWPNSEAEVEAVVDALKQLRPESAQ